MDRVRRFARLVMVLGVGAIVVLARAIHLALRDPRLTPIGRDPFLYLLPAALLAGVALLFGLPTEPKGWPATTVWSAAAVLLGVAAVSMLRLLDPDVIPRFMLLLAGAVLFPWYVLCCRVAHHADARSRQNERLLAVVDEREAEL